MIACVGYDFHITRAFRWDDSARYPILGTEIDDLVRDEPDVSIPPDAPRRPDFCFLSWDASGDDYLMFEGGRLRTKNPRPGLLLRMADWAVRLDAWLLGDNDEACERDGEQLVERQRDRAGFAWNPRYLTRGTYNSGMNPDTPIRPDEWMRLAAAQPDFVMTTHIEAILPSGVRAIPCPPVACWTGHPSGRPVPFFHDQDVIEVRVADEPTIRRMRTLAPALAARAVDDEDRPA